MPGFGQYTRSGQFRNYYPLSRLVRYRGYFFALPERWMSLILKLCRLPWGAIARVKVHYCDLPKLISSLKGIPVYGTFLDGNVIYSETLSANGLIVMGNEGNGISREVEALINRRLYIPNYPQERETSESLNVAIATAVVCAEFRRRLR